MTDRRPLGQRRVAGSSTIHVKSAHVDEPEYDDMRELVAATV